MAMFMIGESPMIGYRRRAGLSTGSLGDWLKQLKVVGSRFTWLKGEGKDLRPASSKLQRSRWNERVQSATLQNDERGKHSEETGYPICLRGHEDVY